MAGGLKARLKLCSYDVKMALPLPWTKKKRTISEIRGEKNAVPSSDIMLDAARSAQGKSRGLSRKMTLPCADRSLSSMIDRTVFFLPEISGMVLFFVQGSMRAQ